MGWSGFEHFRYLPIIKYFTSLEIANLSGLRYIPGEIFKLPNTLVDLRINVSGIDREFLWSALDYHTNLTDLTLRLGFDYAVNQVFRLIKTNLQELKSLCSQFSCWCKWLDRYSRTSRYSKFKIFRISWRIQMYRTFQF